MRVEFRDDLNNVKWVKEFAKHFVANELVDTFSHRSFHDLEHFCQPGMYV